MKNPYPIKFSPVLKEKIWGGEKLKNVLHKNCFSNNVGESWELSGVNGDISVVSNGALKGTLLKNLIEDFKEDLVGSAVYKKFGNTFPLLFKFIDANDDLSIQLHPNDELAQKRHNSFGKTEMWYVVDADKQSKLYVGFDKQYTKDQYLSKFNNGEILEMVNDVEVAKGDVFFIETGTVHAIGKGVLIAEIQQTSDLTYRIFDWNRTDDNGISRELHTDLALDAFDFSKTQIEKISYQNKSNQAENLVTCEYFTTNKLNIKGNFKKELSKCDSFVVYMCVEGSGSITIGTNITEFVKGETILIPAIVNEVEIKGSAELLEVYID
ncbi:mannose-6-phosphate isomerase [Lutibacter sp. HS1-25]|uniref:type I phosphomannose isomerase catalytic subunit n=1 Tax=Lutibacter sp. HS1-25 TaxID=2485000 RepID=UPI001011B2D5|nr:type I phosphomannose isomerase catalytic subunit [Lutibacter sp. HS1-25]RXP45937.1 mannose-6-phosphate isomerase [Lutibacter sp. HS1-25]